MELETNLFVERTIFDGAGTFTSLMTDNHGYVSTSTKPLYGDGVDYTGGDTVNYNDANGVSLTLRPATFPPEQRSGVLTLPAVLALHSHPVHPAPVLRGKFIFNKMACQQLGAPPPGAEEQAPPDSVEAESTNRQRTEEITSAPACAGCHDLINPPGFAFENYDSMGGWRTEDNGIPVDASGSFRLSGGEQFSFANGVELTTQLAASNQVRDCYSLQWARYATGVQLDPEHPVVLDLQSGFRADDDIRGLLLSIATSDLFRYRRGE